MESWCKAIAEGRAPPTVEIGYSAFLNYKESDGYISRQLLVDNYRSIMTAAGTPVELAAEGAPLRFVCNQIRSMDVNRTKLESMQTKFSCEYHSKYETEFCVYMYGSTVDGRALTLRIRGYEPFFDILVPDTLSVGDFSRIIDGEIGRLETRSKSSLRYEAIEAYTATTYSNKPRQLLRIYGSSIAAVKAIYKTLSRTHTTFNDRVTSPHAYYRDFLVQTGLHLGELLVLQSYSHYRYDGVYEKFGRSILHLDASWQSVKMLRDVDANAPWQLYRDPSLLMSWDIETYKPNSIEVPMWWDAEAHISLICCDFSWHWSKKSAFAVAITPRDVDAAAFMRLYPERSTLIVKCTTATQMLCVYSSLVGRFQPSFIADFNGSGYDWPWVIERSTHINQNDKYGQTVSFFSRIQPRFCYSECGRLRHETITSALEGFRGMPKVKISADKMRSCTYLDTDGYVCIDLQVAMLKRDSKANVNNSTSMDYFAGTILKIANKAKLWEDSPDADIVTDHDTHAEGRRILKVYDQGERSDFEAERMAAFTQYCLVDSEICKLMAIEVNLVGDNRAISAKSHISLTDSIWRAGSAKVLGSAIYNGRTLFRDASGYMLVYGLNAAREEPDEEDKTTITGAYVMSPIYGLELWSPVAGLDIQSLYPSVIVQYNIDHSKLIMVLESGYFNYYNMIKQVDAIGWANVNQIDITYNERNYSFFTLAHHNDRKLMGNIPLILEKYMSERAVIKDWANHYGDMIKGLFVELASEAKFESYITVALERYGHTGACDFDSNRLRLLEKVGSMRGQWADVAHRIDFLLFEVASVKLESEALKLLMNTFYGVMGAHFSPLYSIYLSSSVTTIGQKIIKSLYAQALHEGYILHYGDTDSMYVARPNDYGPYLDQQELMYERDVAIDDARAMGMIEAPDYLVQLRSSHHAYYDFVIRDALVDLRDLCARLNEYLRALHEGSDTIVLKFEDVLMTTFKLGKKVYAGLVHIHQPVLNKRLADLDRKALDKLWLVKGFDMVKQGMPRMTTDSTVRMLVKLLDPLSIENMCGVEPWRVVSQEISYLVNQEDWSDYDRFSKASTFRKNKLNPSVHEFVNRLKLRSDPDVPEDGEKFFYVVVKTERPIFNMYGKRQTESVGQRMELLKTAKMNNMVVDKRYYMERQINNTLCKMVAYLFDKSVPEGLEAFEHYKAMKKMAEHYIGGQISMHLNESTITHIDARHFISDLLASAGELAGRVLQSTFSSKKSGIFRTHINTPILLASQEPAAIVELVQNSHSAVKQYMAYGVGRTVRERDELLVALGRIMVDVRKAYEKLQKSIITWRTMQLQASDFVIESDSMSVIISFLDILEDVAVSNLVATVDIARRSYERALQIR